MESIPCLDSDQTPQLRRECLMPPQPANEEVHDGRHFRVVKAFVNILDDFSAGGKVPLDMFLAFAFVYERGVYGYTLVGRFRRDGLNDLAYTLDF